MNSANFSHRVLWASAMLIWASFAPLAPAWAQAMVTGRVIAQEDKMLLPGVNVIEKGTRNGTTTAADGTFSLKLTGQTATLVFSFVGFRTTEVVFTGQDSIKVKLRSNCFRDWFDHSKFGLQANSGLFHNPVGGKLDFSLPWAPWYGTIRSEFGYQTNLAANHFVNAELGLYHLLTSCHYDMDVRSQYRAFRWDDQGQTTIYALETSLNFNHSRLPLGYLQAIVGIGRGEMAQTDPDGRKWQSAPLLGLGTWLGRPLNVAINGKVTLFAAMPEYQAQIRKDYRHFRSFLRFYQLGAFTELSLGAGWSGYYRLTRGKRK
jgi:CarboxypepD_reg-like domain